MNENNVIEKIQEYLNQSTAYLSERTDYARGYKAGVRTVKDIIADIIMECGVDETHPN